MKKVELSNCTCNWHWLHLGDVYPTTIRFPLMTVSTIVNLLLLVEKTEVQGENHQPAGSHWQTLSHNVVSRTPSYEQD